MTTCHQAEPGISSPPTLRPTLEVGGIFQRHGDRYLANHRVSPMQAKVMRRLAACRTAKLGGHVDACRQCRTLRVSYNSCRDRHCPKCNASKQAAWLEARLSRLLPVPYFHVVFTVPQQLNPLMLKNQRLLYNLLFRAASQTLLELSRNPKRLGAQVGFTAVLHTWGQNLLFHPHLHCVVTGGGLSADGQSWVAARERYFLPVLVLGKLFRGKFLAEVKALWQAGKLNLSGSVSELAGADAFNRLLSGLYRQSWVVYAKPPFAGAEHVFRYLGRYTHRVAISNRRLLDLKDDRVLFRYKDYADKNQWKSMSLEVDEFMRRFLMHVLPKGLVRIRHYGLLAAGNVNTKLARCMELLGAHGVSTIQSDPELDLTNPELESDCLTQPSDEPTGLICPTCGCIMTRYPLETILALRRRVTPAVIDSS